jgi:hypothetical protein
MHLARHSSPGLALSSKSAILPPFLPPFVLLWRRGLLHCFFYPPTSTRNLPFPSLQGTLRSTYRSLRTRRWLLLMQVRLEPGNLEPAGHIWNKSLEPVSGNFICPHSVLYAHHLRTRNHLQQRLSVTSYITIAHDFTDLRTQLSTPTKCACTIAFCSNY